MLGPDDLVFLLRAEDRRGNKVPQCNKLCEKHRIESVSKVKVPHPLVMLES